MIKIRWVVLQRNLYSISIFFPISFDTAYIIPNNVSMTLHLALFYQRPVNPN